MEAYTDHGNARRPGGAQARPALLRAAGCSGPRACNASAADAGKADSRDLDRMMLGVYSIGRSMIAAADWSKVLLRRPHRYRNAARRTMPRELRAG